MKTSLCAFFLLCVTWVSVNAQNLIPNGGFEHWSTNSYMLPTNYVSSSNVRSFVASNVATATRTSSAYHGTYAVQLTTVAPVAPATDTTGGYFSNATNTDTGDPTTWTGGIPYTQMPTGIKGYYMYNVNSADSALVGVVFKKNGVGYANYFYAVGGVHSAYAPFAFTFTPALTQAPDSIIFVATSSNLLKFSGLPGSTVTFDSISFTGVSQQPALMNGDFESWTNFTTSPTPTNWTEGDISTVSQTTDAYVGTYALELKSIAGQTSKNGTFQLNVGSVSDGQWNNTTSTFTNGFPCKLSQGTLSFYYKYTPANPNDHANVNINFKAGTNTNVGGNGIQLNAASTYKQVTLSFINSAMSDSAMINIESSAWQGQTWQDTAKSYVGADLKIDGLTLTSTTTGVIQNSADASISFYPNPMKETGVFDIPLQVELTGMSLRIFNVAGIAVKVLPVNANSIYLNKGDLLPGIYYYEFSRGGALVKQGKIIVE